MQNSRKFSRLTGPMLLLAAAVAFAVCGGRPSSAARSSLSAASADLPAAAEASASRPGLLILEDPPQPLQPQRPRTEAEEDRVEAISLFAAGRMLERRQKYAEALRLYQRALRRDPGAAAVARAIVPLAFRLKRHGEAVRYALKTAELEEADPLLLRRLGVYLTQKNDWAGAVKLYEKALAARSGEKQTAADILIRMEMGRLYHLVEQYDKAADSFRRVLHALDNPKESGVDEKLEQVLLGEPGPTYRLFGECFLLSGRLEEAQAAFEKSHQLEPNKGRLHFQLARLEKRRGNPEKAIENLQIAFKEKLADEGTEPYKLLAEMLEACGRSKELLAQLEKFHADDPENAPLGHFLAQQYFEAGKIDKAEPLYDALLKTTPTLDSYRNLVEIYRKAQRPAAMLATLGAVAEKTGTLEALDAETKAITGDDELMRGLVEAARRANKDEPKKLDYGANLAVALLALEAGQFETAAEFFNSALRAEPDRAAELLLLWGLSLLLEERPADAAKVFRQAIDEKALPEDNPAFHFYLAGALALDDRTEEALAAAQKAAKLDNSPRYHSRVAWVFYHAKRNDEAIEAYRRLIDTFDSDRKSRETRQVMRDARLALSSLYVLKNDLAEAEEWLEQVLDEFPDDVGASNDLGYLWADQDKHLARALRMIRLAVEAEPDNFAYRDSLGWVYYRLGRYEDAVAELEKAAEQASEDGRQPDPVILDHLGDAYQAAGQTKKAKQSWRKAVEAFEKQNELERVNQTNKKIKNL